MQLTIFCHSLISDWNHGNAHFLRGIVSELLGRGHQVKVYEPASGWSLKNLVAEHGESPVRDFYAAFPSLRSIAYDSGSLNLDAAVDGSDLVIVHEWSDPVLVRRIGEHRRGGGRYRLLFHDTHHRSVTDREAMAAYDLRGYDGVLVFGAVIRELYLARGWARRAWVWHEAADTRVFRPMRASTKDGDLIWIGNWGDEERSEELREFLLEPARDLGLRARVHGVRYPQHARDALSAAGVEYCGWLANYRVPEAFSRFAFTVHVPRRPYARALPGIPTIRVFEALACGIPLISAPWQDAEGLFRPGRDFLVARTGEEMRLQMRRLLDDPATACELSRNGLETILARHTCSHRVDELLKICQELQ